MSSIYSDTFLHTRDSREVTRERLSNASSSSYDPASAPLSGFPTLGLVPTERLSMVKCPRSPSRTKRLARKLLRACAATGRAIRDALSYPVGDVDPEWVRVNTHSILYPTYPEEPLDWASVETTRPALSADDLAHVDQKLEEHRSGIELDRSDIAGADFGEIGWSLPPSPLGADFPPLTRSC